MAFEYVYTVSTSLLGGLDESQLHREISFDEDIVQTLDGLRKEGDEVKIFFDDELSEADESRLGVLLGVHVPTVFNSSESEGIGEVSGRTHYRQSPSESSTSSSSQWKEKIILEETYLEGGIYLISWNYSWNYSDNKSKFLSRVAVDGSTIWEQEQEPQDTNNYCPSAGKRYYHLETGPHQFSLGFQSGKNGKTASMKYALLEIKKFRED